jgi:hypothetical protein
LDSLPGALETGDAEVDAFDSKASKIKRDMAQSLQRVRELKTHMQTGAQTLEAVSIKLSRQWPLGGDDPVLQRVANIHAPGKLTPVEPAPSHAVEEGPLYISNLAQRISGSLPELDMDLSHSHRLACSPRKLAYNLVHLPDILAHLLQWQTARLCHKHAFLNLHFWALHVRLIKKYAGCIARVSNRRDLTMMTRSFDTWHANVYERGKLRTVTLNRSPSKDGAQQTGIGIVFGRPEVGREASGPYKIHSVAPAGTAFQSGLIHAGDLLFNVNGDSVLDLTAEQITALILGTPSSPITLTISTPPALKASRQAASEYSRVNGIGIDFVPVEDKSLAFPIFKKQQIKACRSPPPPPPPMTDSSVEKPLPPAPTGPPQAAAHTVRWANDSISQRTPKGLRTSDSSVGEDGVVSAARTVVGNQQQVQTAHCVPVREICKPFYL